MSHLSSNILNLFFLLVVTTPNWSGKAKLLTVFTSDSESSSVVSNSVILWNSSGQNTGVGSLSLLQGIFSTQGSNPGLEPRSPALQGDSLPVAPQGKPQNTGVDSLSLLQQIFLIQESNQGLLHRRQILHQLSYQGSPHIWCLVPEPLNIRSWGIPSNTITPAPKVFTSLEQVGSKPFPALTLSAAHTPSWVSPHQSANLKVSISPAKHRSGKTGNSLGGHQPASIVAEIIHIRNTNRSLQSVLLSPCKCSGLDFSGWFMLHSRNANYPSCT